MSPDSSREKLAFAAAPSIQPNLEADRLLESGQPLKEVVAIFPDKIAGYHYFAHRTAQRFAVAEEHCAVCNEPCGDRPYAFIWRADLNTAKTVLLSFLLSAVMIIFHHLHTHTIAVRFATYHRICAGCWRRYRLRRGGVAVVEKILFTLLITVLFLLVPTIIFTGMAIVAVPEMLAAGLIGTVSGLVLLGLLILGFRGCRRWVIPYSLRSIGRSPFFLERVEKGPGPSAGQ